MFYEQAHILTRGIDLLPGDMFDLNPGKLRYALIVQVLGYADDPAKVKLIFLFEGTLHTMPAFFSGRPGMSDYLYKLVTPEDEKCSVDGT